MEVQEQHVGESEKDQFRALIKLHSGYAFKICSKKCITNFKSKDLIDKEKICMSKCFDRKMEALFMTTGVLNTFVGASQKKQQESGGFAQ